MSSYSRMTKHPETGNWEYAQWLDDYYGSHKYGVKFPDQKVFDPREYEMETKELNV